MATASRLSVSLKTDGNTVTVSVPSNDVARLMYYLQCVTTGIGLSILPSDLTDYRHYQQLTTARRNLIFKNAYELSPDLLIDKVICLDNNSEVIPYGYNNEFCTISAAASLVSIQQDFLLAGKAQSASRVMFYNTTWLETHYWELLRRNKFSIARAIGSLHCFHCNGSSGLCSCSNFGCPRDTDTQCQGFDSTANIELLTDLFQVLNTIPSTPPSSSNDLNQNSNTQRHLRWIVCDDYDLCEACYTSNVHDLSHDFALIKSPGAQPRALALNAINTQRLAMVVLAPISKEPVTDADPATILTFAKIVTSQSIITRPHQFKAIEHPGANPIPLPTRAWLHPPSDPPAPASVRPSTPASNIPRPPSSSAPSPGATTDLPPPYDESTPFFYHDLSISDLKKYLQAQDVAYNDVLDRESLTRHSAGLGHSRGLHDYHRTEFIPTRTEHFDGRPSVKTSIAVDKRQLKDAFQLSRPTVVQVPSTGTPSTDSPIKLDDKVLLSELKTAAMNGKTGKVVSVDIVAGRAEAYIEDLGKSFKVKFENVALDTASESSELLD